MEELEDVAVCQATKTPRSEDQTMFMKSVTDKRFGSGTATHLGWYPTLFYDCGEDSCERDVLVTDVHTDWPSVAQDDPGCPVFGSYEFVTPIDQRLTDEEFEPKLPWMRAPRWAEQSYLCSAFADASSDEEN
ncbi:hypothetical protein PRNP1_006860 [Phytophthora ramorum]